MKTRNWQKEIDHLNEKVKLLERIIELERQVNVLKSQPIYIPCQPYVPSTQPWPPYQPTWIGDTTAQSLMLKDNCEIYMISN